MLKKIFHALWMLLLTLLVLVAAALTAARLLIPEVSAYRVELEQAAGEVLHKQVTIGRMQASWRGMNPVIRLKDVQLTDPASGQESLSVREVRVTLDAERYLTRQEIRIAGIDVIGAELTLIRDTTGVVYLKGFRPEHDDSKLLAELMQMSLSVHDVDITYIDELTADLPRRFTGVSLSLRNYGATHTLTGYTLLPDSLGYRADVEAVLYGDSPQPLDWRGHIYLKGQSLSLSGLPAQWLVDGQVLQGVADFRLWFDVDTAVINAVSGEIDTSDLKISQQSETGSYTFEANSLRGQFGWRSHGDDWQFAVQNMVVNQQQGSWETRNLSLAGRQQQDATSIKGVSSLVVLDGVGALLPVIPGLTVEQRQLLAGLQPSGAIEDLVFSISRRDNVTRVNEFSSHFSGLSIEQSGSFPKLVGIDGTLSGDMESGTLSLASHNAGLYDERLFRELLPVDIMQGDLHWQLIDGTMEIATDELVIRNQDLSLLVRAGLYFPVAGGAESLNLSVDIETADVGQLHRYLPARVMSEHGVEWLDHSLKSGVITDGSVVVNGRLDQLPFDHGEGILEVRLPVSNAVLDFNEDWSPLTGLDAQVDFNGRAMDIVSSQGGIRSARLKTVHAQIKDLANPVLTLKGDVLGPLPVMLAELDSSPLGNTYGGFVDNVEVSGEATLGLDLVVPLTKVQAPIEVAGRIALHNNSLKVKDSDIELQQISGRLDFDSQGIQGDKLQVQLFGHPASARVWTDTDKEQTNISLEGPLQLFDHFIDKQSFLGAAVSGSSEWRVLVTIRGLPERGKSADIGVTVTSNLVGTVIDLPAPFGKRRETVRPLSIVVDRIDVPEKRLRLSYSDLLGGVLLIAPGDKGYALRKGAITVGGKAPVLPDAEKLLFSGHLVDFRLTDWQPYLAADREGSKNGDGEGDKDGGPPLEFALTMTGLEVLGYELRDVSVSMRSSGVHWEIIANGPDLAGDIELKISAAGLDKLTMNLQRLVLDSSSRTQMQSGSGRDHQPEQFPELQIIIEHLLYDETDLGLLEIKGGWTTDHVYQIERVVLSSDLLTARMSGSWQLQGGEQTSTADVEISAGKMDRLMELFGYQKNIDQGTLSGSMSISWPGPPWAYSTPATEGKVKLRIANGQLLDVEPGAAGRMLGLLSLNSLPRRLALDFSDLFAKGFSFNEISGSFVIDDGNAYTNDLLVDGPAARIEISGRIGLADQDYDELVTVIPSVKTGIPLAGTLAGGPVVGAALLVAQTLLEGKFEPLNRIAQKQYSLTGSWDDPVIEKLRFTTPDVESEVYLDTE
jgi:uncharacterized protein (TIGR02099 family)